MTKDKTQLERIVEILERDGQIDNFHAIHSRISLRLGARIWDLRAQGWVIETEQREDKNTVYRVVRQPEAKQLELV
jgi:helix-turn-helix protein